MLLRDAKQHCGFVYVVKIAGNMQNSCLLKCCKKKYIYITFVIMVIFGENKQQIEID